MVRCFLSQIYIRMIVLLPTEVRMIQVVDLLADHLLVKVWSILPSSTPWWRCGWKHYWTQLGLLLCADVSFVFRKVRIADENDKGLFGSRLVAPRPDKYVGLDLTWSDAETFAGIYLDYKAYQDSTNILIWCKWRTSRLLRLRLRLR